MATLHILELKDLGYPETCSVDHGGLELTDPPGPAFRVLGLKACATTPGWVTEMLYLFSELSLGVGGWGVGVCLVAQADSVSLCR